MEREQQLPEDAVEEIEEPEPEAPPRLRAAGEDVLRRGQDARSSSLESDIGDRLLRVLHQVGRIDHVCHEHAGGLFGDDRVSFEQLFQPDVADRLDDVRGQLRGVDIALTRPERLDQNPGLFGTLIPIVYGHSAPSVTVHVGMGRFGPRDRYLDAQTEAHIFEIAEHAQDLVDQLVITGRSRRTGKSARVDLVNERLFAERQLPRSPQGGSMPDAGPTFDELDQRITAFQADWQKIAKPIDWRYTRRDLNDLLDRLNQRDQLPRAA